MHQSDSILLENIIFKRVPEMDRMNYSLGNPRPEIMTVGLLRKGEKNDI